MAVQVLGTNRQSQGAETIGNPDPITDLIDRFQTQLLVLVVGWPMIVGGQCLAQIMNQASKYDLGAGTQGGGAIKA